MVVMVMIHNPQGRADVALRLFIAGLRWRLLFFFFKPVYLFNNVLIYVTTAVSEDPQRPAFYFLVSVCAHNDALCRQLTQSECIFPRIE